MDKASEIKPPLKIKTLCCQVDTKHKDLDYNLERFATSLLKHKKEDKFDVILLPEMVTTGYSFKDIKDVEPYAEISGRGKQFDFCSKIAKFLNAYVMCGYPEVFIDEKGDKKYYNALYIVDRDGKLLENYRKHHLYKDDKLWAEPGDRFLAIELTNTDGVKFKGAVAICMDLQPYEFKDFEAYELGTFCRKEKIDALFFSTAWTGGENAQITPNILLNYWLSRMEPMLYEKELPGSYEKKWVFFCADRVGNEGSTTFAGCSCAMKINPMELVNISDKTSEGYLVSEVYL
jgi:protein N-terminal amidase